MSCKVKEKSLTFLREKGAIGEKREVIDYSKFTELNTVLTNLAFNKYGVGNGKTMLFSEESVYSKQLIGNPKFLLRAVPNEALFNVLQIATDSYEELLFRESEANLTNLISDKERRRAFSNSDVRETELTYTLNEFILFGTTTLKPGGTSGRYLNAKYDVQEAQRGNLEDLGEESLNQIFTEFAYQESQVAKFKTTTAIEVLNNILLNYSNFTEEAGDLIEKTKILLSKIPKTVKVSVVPKNELSTTAYMSYDVVANTIKINPEILNLRDTRKAVESFLHEAVHAVTFNAYNNPITIEQQMFSDLIDEKYNYYLNNAKKKKLYGFKNQTEFISEIFVNPVFQEELKSVDEQNENFWNKFINAIRRLFGYSAKSPAYTKIIDAIVSIAGTKQEVGKLKQNDLSTIFKEEVTDDPHVDVSTLEKKLDYTISKLDQSLKLSIQSLERQSKRHKEEDKKEAIDKQIENLREIQNNIQEFQVTNQVLALEIFAESMSASMKNIVHKLNQVDLTDRDYLINSVKVYKQIVSTYSVIDDVQKVLSDVRQNLDQTVATEEDLIRIENIVSMAGAEFNVVSNRLYTMLKDAMRFVLNDIKYFPHIEKEHYNRLAKEHSQSKLTSNKEQWIINTMLNRDKDKIQTDLKKEIDNLLENPASDIYAQDVLFSSSINVSSRLIQIMNQMLLEIDNRRNALRIEKDKEFEALFKELIESKGTDNITTLYENILDISPEGKPYLKGEYKIGFYTNVHQKIKQLEREYRDKTDELRFEMYKHVVNTDEYNKYKEKIKDTVQEGKKVIKEITDENFILDKDKNLVVKDKWKNDLSSLSDVERKTLKFFIDLLEEIQGMTHPNKAENTIKYSYHDKNGNNIKFYELPKITKTDAERFWTGDGLSIITDKVTDLKKTRPDDIGYRTKHTDLAGREIKSLKLWYRDPAGMFSNKDQSLDLMTVMRLDYINAATYQTRGESEQELHFLIDIARQKGFEPREGTSKTRNNWNKKYRVIEGDKSNVYKMMNNMMESRFYDNMNKNNIKLGKADLNKVVSFINNASAFLTLSLNLASGTANVFNANSQLFLESFLKGHFITAGGIKKANAIYATNLMESMKDIQRPINRSFVNQVNEYFNTRGLFNLSNANFLKNDMLKAGLSTNSLQVFQESGEHYIQSITSLSILAGIKVLDKDGNFINKEGKVVKDGKSAASLLDMMEVDKVDGVVKLNDNVVYTTHSKISKWNEGGKEKVDMLIRKKLYDVLGNYTETDQAEIMRLWYGKLLMLYRKFLVPMGQARLRGVETAFKSKDKLTADEKRFSYALQEYEEGTYTSFIRYVITSAQQKKFFLTSKEKVWNTLSDYEKHNIKRAMVEFAVTTVMLPLSIELVIALAGGDDEKAYFLAYQLRRLDTELSQYWSIGESFKMMRSPIPSARLIETSLGIFLSVGQFWKWDEEYANGYNKGKNKIMTKIYKQIPVVKEFQRTYQDLFEYQNSSWGTGL